MLLKVIVTVDVDTTDTDIEDMRDDILIEALMAINNDPETIEIESYDTH